MSLQQYLLEKTQQDMAATEARYKDELMKKEAKIKDEVRDAERRYKSLVTDEIERSVKRANFNAGKKQRFQQGSERVLVFMKLYDEVLLELLKTDFAAKLVDQLVKASEGMHKSDMTVQIYGQHGALLEPALKKNGFSTVTHHKSGDFGGVRIVGKDKDFDLSFEQLRKDAMKHSLLIVSNPLFA